MIKSSKESDYGRSIQAGLSHTEWQALPFTAPQHKEAVSPMGGFT